MPRPFFSTEAYPACTVQRKGLVQNFPGPEDDNRFVRLRHAGETFADIAGQCAATLEKMLRTIVPETIRAIPITPGRSSCCL